MIVLWEKQKKMEIKQEYDENPASRIVTKITTTTVRDSNTDRASRECTTRRRGVEWRGADEICPVSSGAGTR